MRPSYRPRVHVLLSALVAVMTWTPTASAGQAPLGLELRGGAAVPIQSFRSGGMPGEGTSTGGSFGLEFVLTGTPSRSLAAGFGQHRFSCVAAGCRDGGSYVATNIDLGYRFNLTTWNTVVPWIGLSGITTRVELDAHPDYPGGVSKLGYGGEAAVGVLLAALSAVSLNPAVRLVGVNTRLPGGDLLRMRYVIADVGLVVAF